MILSGNNTYTAATAVNAGTLQAGSPTALSPNSAYTVASGATLNLNGFTNAIGSLAGSGTVTNSTGAATLTTQGNGSSTLFSGTLQNGGGTLALIKSGAGTLTLSGISTYSGATTVSVGTLKAGSTTAFSANSDFTVGSTLDLNGFSNSVGSLAGSGTITNSSATPVTLTAGGDNNASTTFSGVLNDGTGTLGLNKTGTGTLILTGTNTYTNTTTVSAGQLSIQGTLSSLTVNVQSGATLGGTGTLSGTVTVNSGGILSPGTTGTAGTLTLGSLVLNTGSKSNFDLGPAGTVGGTSNDLVTVTGALSLGGTLNIADLGSFGTGVYRLFNYGSLTSNTMTIGTLPAGVSAGALTIQTGSNQVNLTVNGTLLPEYWDGPVLTGTGTVSGGTGTWDNSTTNWTTSAGSPNTNWRQGLAVFEGTAGTVTVGAPVTKRRPGLCDHRLPDHHGKRFNDYGRNRHALGGRQRNKRNHWRADYWRRGRDRNRSGHGDLDCGQHLHGGHDHQWRDIATGQRRQHHWTDRR